MKSLLIAVALMCATVAAHADTLTDAIAQAKIDLGANTKALQIASDTGVAAGANYDQLKAEMGTVIPAIAKVKADETDAKMEHDTVHALYEDLGHRMAIHNGHICETTEDNRSACDAYNAERDALNAEGKALAVRRDAVKAREAANEKTHALLMGQVNRISTDSLSDFAIMKKARADFSDLMEKRAQIVQSWQHDCQILMMNHGNASNDFLKNQCGNVQFDGTAMTYPYPQPPDPPSF
jgi:hypothetical protein